MRKLKLVLGLLFLPVTVCAQLKPDAVHIKVRNLALVGATQISAAEQQQIASEINRLALFADSVDGVSERVRYALQERGFVRAFVDPPDVKVVSSSPSEDIIDATYHVDLGQQYRLKEIAFSNVTPDKGFALPVTELRQSFPIVDGEVFNVEKIRNGLEKLRELYADHGYVNFTPVPNTDANGQLDTITLRIDVDEGLIYRLGRLVLEGVEPAAGAGAKLVQAWKPYEGQVFSPKLLQGFARENTAYLPPNAMLFPTPDGFHRVVNVLLELDPAPTN